MAVQKDLQLLIGEMNPRHNPGEYVYCSVPGSINFNEEQVLFTFKEEEGLSVILKKEYADELGVEYDFVASWITLTVHSALDAVGLTAAFSKALADAEISCNVIAATFHDHIFVNSKDTEKALSVLNELQLTVALQKTYCVTCGTQLIDKHCHHCGEKVVSSTDFTFSKLLEQGIDIFTHLDSKLFKSLKGLVFKPGLLTVEYIRGVRKPYMKPFQVFLLSNILFFLFLSSADIFLVPSQWFFSDYYPGISQLAKSVAEQQNKTLGEIALLYDSKVASNSKLFIVLIVPIIAIGSWLFGFRKHKEFGKHLVHALYLLSFSMVYAVALSQIGRLIPSATPEIFLRIVGAALFMIYVYVSLKKFLEQKILLCVVNTVFLTALFFSTMLTYRYIISWATLKFFI